MIRKASRPVGDRRVKRDPPMETSGFDAMLTFARYQNVQVFTGGVGLEVIEAESLNFLGGHDDR